MKMLYYLQVIITLNPAFHKQFLPDDRIPRYAVLFAQFDIPVDVFPYTRAELDRMQKKGNTFIQAMLDEGISLSKRLKQVSERNLKSPPFPKGD